MNVSIVINSLAPGGAEQSTVALLPYLQERGVRPQVVVLRRRPDRAELDDVVRSHGVPIVRLDSSRGRRGWIRQLRRHMLDDRPHLVHTCLFEADVCGRLAAASVRVPVVSTLPSELYGPGHLEDAGLNPLKVRASRAADAATARLTRRLHAVSCHVADTMSERLRYPRHRIDVIHRGRPAELAVGGTASERAAVRAALGVDDNHRLVLAVARHERAKGLDRAVAALPGVLAHDPAVRLLVAGRAGEHTPDLDAQVGRLGLEGVVHMLGHRHDVGALLRAADAFVLLSRREGMPGALLEAMAAGTPAVVSDLPQICEVVSGDEALIVDADDAQAVAGAIWSVLADPLSTRSRVDRARCRFVEQFTLDGVADRTREFYERALR